MNEGDEKPRFSVGEKREGSAEFLHEEYAREKREVCRGSA